MEGTIEDQFDFKILLRKFGTLGQLFIKIPRITPEFQKTISQLRRWGVLPAHPKVQRIEWI